MVQSALRDSMISDVAVSCIENELLAKQIC